LVVYPRKQPARSPATMIIFWQALLVMALTRQQKLADSENLLSASFEKDTVFHCARLSGMWSGGVLRVRAGAGGEWRSAVAAER
jgi:hypothetical protein